MNKKIGLLSLFLPFLLASCSSDEPASSNNGGNAKGCGYVAVNIVQPKSETVRAESTGFEYGTDDENTADEALFFIFDQTDNILADNGAQRLKLNGSVEGSTPGVERIYNAVLIISGVDQKPTNAKKIACVLNAPAGFETGVTTLDDLKNKIDDYGAHTSGTFIMSNSVFKGADGQEVLATTIEDSDIKTTEALALAQPINIYVERVVAKIRVETEQVAGEGTGFKNTEGANVTIDGVQHNYKIRITGIEIANIAEKSYMFKNMTAINTGWTWVNEPSNNRSYWETVPAVGGENGLTFSNKSYNNIAQDGFDIMSLTGDQKYIEYVQPNTYNQQKTAVLVTAELTEADGSAIETFVYIRGGYTTPAGAKNVVASYLASQGYYKKTGTNSYVQLGADDLTWKNSHDDNTITGLKDYEVIAQLANDNIEIYNLKGEKIENGATVVNNTLKSATNYRARVYTSGKCYYFVPIDHSAVAGAAAGTYEGVVRNHIYSLTLQSIKGLGTPVFDPQDIIIPDKPSDEDTYYLAAKINVLAWKLATQNVNFEGQ